MCSQDHGQLPPGHAIISRLRKFLGDDWDTAPPHIIVQIAEEKLLRAGLVRGSTGFYKASWYKKCEIVPIATASRPFLLVARAYAAADALEALQNSETEEEE